MAPRVRPPGWSGNKPAPQTKPNPIVEMIFAVLVVGGFAYWYFTRPAPIVKELGSYSTEIVGQVVAMLDFAPVPEDFEPDIDKVLAERPLERPISTVFMLMGNKANYGALVAVILTGQMRDNAIRLTCRYLQFWSGGRNNPEVSFIYRPGAACPKFEHVDFNRRTMELAPLRAGRP